MTGKALIALIVAVAAVIGIGIGAASAGVEKLYVRRDGFCSRAMRCTSRTTGPTSACRR